MPASNRPVRTVEGKSGRSNGEEDEEEGAIPAKALLTFRNVIGMVAIARDSKEPFKVDNVEYRCTDTYVLGCAIEKYPELNQVCNNLLPEGAQREDDGTGEGTVCNGGAERQQAGEKAKKKGVGQSVAEATSAAMKMALVDIEPQLGKVGGSEKSEWAKKREEHACKTAEHNSKASGLALHKEITESHAEFSKKIVEEKEKAEGYQTRVRLLRKMLAGVEKEMFGDEQ
ncbi:unnamed protein product [Ectocarpus sp. CCAP 1310/34]|nr:unnamed protein product [Ectocarpus sp. CCAP 1310/34]